MFLAARQKVKFLDWLGRIRGSRAGSSALVTCQRRTGQEAKSVNWRGTISNMFQPGMNQKGMKESERILNG